MRLQRVKQIEIPHCDELATISDLGRVSLYLDAQEEKSIDILSWPEYAYKPDITFSMAHCGDCIFIKFKVIEKAIQAHNRQNNSQVSEDSCVEFFVSLEGGDEYYNFEFNCIATCKAAFGPKDRKQRTYLPDDVIDRIRRQAVIRKGGQSPADLVTWDLTVSIPAEAFCYHDITSFKGLHGSANFYKCGDKLPEPHFLAWNEVRAPRPDFHLPEFFGKILFL